MRRCLLKKEIACEISPDFGGDIENLKLMKIILTYDIGTKRVSSLRFLPTVIILTCTLTDEDLVINGGQGGVTFKWMQSRIVRKAVLSHDPRQRPDFTAMILFGGPIKLAVWRPGDTAWTGVKSERATTVCDVICFKEEYYVVSANNFLYKVDMGSDPKIGRTILCVPNGIPMPWRYLVDFKGELLLVLRSQEDFPTKTCYVVVRNLEEKTWDEQDDLNGNALFVGSNSALVLDVGRFPMCVRNGVYYSDMSESYFWLDYGHDFGIFNTVNETIERFYPSEDEPDLPVAQQLLWFTPNP